MPAYLDPITVFVVDDHTLFRRGLMALIGQDAGLQVIGDASDASEALRQVPQLQPQVILLDNHLPGVLGVDAIAGLRQASPTSRVVMLTVSEDGQDLATALRNGAQGYLLKTMDGELLFEAIRRRGRGGAGHTGRSGFAFAFVAARRGGAARNCPGCEQQGNCPAAGYCRNHGEDSRAAHFAQAGPVFAGAGGGVRL